jgi:hypothetical protein
VQVAFVFVIDTVHQALVTNIRAPCAFARVAELTQDPTVYDYTISHFGNLFYLLFVSKCVLAPLDAKAVTLNSLL